MEIRSNEWICATNVGINNLFEWEFGTLMFVCKSNQLKLEFVFELFVVIAVFKSLTIVQTSQKEEKYGKGTL